MMKCPVCGYELDNDDVIQNRRCPECGYVFEDDEERVKLFAKKIEYVINP